MLITLVATSLTTRPPPDSMKRKFHQNLKIVKFSLYLYFKGIQTLVFLNKSNIFLIVYTFIP